MPTPHTPFADVSETHAAVVFLAGDRAFKLKKPVDLGFLDFSTRANRLAALRNELDLNRRLAPDVYLGISDVMDVDGSLLDHLLVMRRMPADRQMGHLVRSGADVTDALRGIAAVLADFHGRCARSAAIDADGTREALRERWRRNLEVASPYVGSILDEHTHDEIQALVEAYLSGRAPLFEARSAAHAVLDGHGDLLADDVFVLEDGPRVLDCLEFDEHLRHVDRMDDIASLAVDLERLGGVEPAELLIDEYRAASGEDAAESLVHHFMAYRAFVRGMVACLPGSADPESAGALMELARRHLREGRVRLVVVGGAPGTGKTTVARALGVELGWDVLRSDEVRKGLAGLGPGERASADFGHGIYTEEWSRRTYDELLRRAEDELGSGRSVILDATWSDVEERQAVARTAATTSSELVEVRCDLPADLAAERITARRGDASDADAEVARAMRADFDAWPSATVVDTRRPVAEVVTSLVRRLRMPGE